MHQKLEAYPAYEVVEAAADVIGLLRLIKRLMYNYQSHKYSIRVVHKALRKLYTLQQGRHADIQEYLRQLQS